MRISDDKQVATLDIHAGTYRADQVEALIEGLAALRAEMLPAVPMSPGTNPSEQDPAAIRARGDPCVQVAVMRDGMTRFWVRHGGLGWFGFNLPVDRARTLAQHILGLAEPQEAAHDFFALKRRESDSRH
jgi:hypothetical protein